MNSKSEQIVDIGLDKLTIKDGKIKKIFMKLNGGENGCIVRGDDEEEIFYKWLSLVSRYSNEDSLEDIINMLDEDPLKKTLKEIVKVKRKIK